MSQPACLFCGAVITHEEASLPTIHRVDGAAVLQCASCYIEQAEIETELVLEAVHAVQEFLDAFGPTTP